MAKEDELLIALLRVVGNSDKHQKRKVLGEFEEKKWPETKKIETLKREFGFDCEC